MRSAGVVATLVGLLGAGAGLGQPPAGTGITEQLEVREVGVLADLPAELRGKPAAELASLLVVLEDGAARELSAIQPLAPPGAPAFGSVQVAFDALHCSPEVVERGALALGAAAAELTGLGPVSLAEEAASDPFAPAPATGDAEALARRLLARARAGCPRPGAGAARLPETMPCSAPPCLLIWVSSGWGSGPALEAALAGVEPAARSLAASGWTVLGLAPVEAQAPTGHGREPESRPGDDRSSWTVDLLDPGNERSSPRSAADYRRQVELELAPLRRVVAATIGALVTRADRLAGALEALRGRSLVFYRTDRPPGGGPVPLEVRERRAGGARLRVAEWAPALRP